MNEIAILMEQQKKKSQKILRYITRYGRFLLNGFSRLIDNIPFLRCNWMQWHSRLLYMFVFFSLLFVEQNVNSKWNEITRWQMYKIVKQKKKKSKKTHFPFGLLQKLKIYFVHMVHARNTINNIVLAFLTSFFFLSLSRNNKRKYNARANQSK